jgi:hypothetical protein
MTLYAERLNSAARGTALQENRQPFPRRLECVVVRQITHFLHESAWSFLEICLKHAPSKLNRGSACAMLEKELLSLPFPMAVNEGAG